MRRRLIAWAWRIEVVAAEKLSERVQALAETLIANSPESLKATKRLMAAQNRAWLDAAVAEALEANAHSRETADFREGVTAFLRSESRSGRRDRGLSQSGAEAHRCFGTELHFLTGCAGGEFDDFKTRGRYVEHAQVGDDAMDDAGSGERQRAVAGAAWGRRPARCAP